VLGIAFGGIMMPALFGTTGSHTDNNQVIDSAWQGRAVAPAAPIGNGDTISALPASTDAAVVSVPTGVAPIEEYVEPWATMVVREGDTLSDLAVWFGIPAEQIAAANGLTLDDYVVVGATIVIPVPVTQFIEPPVPVVYVPLPPAPEPMAEAAPAQAITPTPAPPPVFTGGASEVVAAICSLPWPCDQMVRIAQCESGLNPNSKNPAGYYGLFQINFYFDGWNIPLVNAQTAYYSKYLPALTSGGDGTSPWPHCRHY
jgi:LysM repeat protein